ncbi:hypothetical protein DesfrDRAFT_0063 [Solidesulfovibrio fructosivorans JJ]]|uniref:Uncharacterized protein n=1 Tax=Solidesulfovibrio fructosivorans JJ] TaxID=596151 RepID=E1JR14_SOLFR|nr:hypothetical protein [Solidesulfovibrio fructosivorans]EFL53015.1 hypothetical protein DesfrDRAFT_0063 [Solidesulfovibrio fructosivorans JJ]]
MDFKEIVDSVDARKPLPTPAPPRVATPLDRIADLADLLARVIQTLVADCPDIPDAAKAKILNPKNGSV